MESVDKPWHCLTGDEALQRLGAPANGLSSAEAKNRRAVIGPNAIAETKPVSPWAIFFAQFKSILIWLLIGASVVSGALGEATDSFVILAIVFLNAVVGFYQEYSAEKSIAALKQMTAPRAKVWRDGAVTTSASADVVPGDLLELESGDLVAADARLLSAASLTCVEAALTGESEPVGKSIEALDNPEFAIGDRTNMVFMGTSVATGSGRAVVVATGMRTEMGHIASLISEAGAEAETPLQQKLERFGHVLLWATLGTVTLLFGLGFLRKEPILDLFMTSVSLAVAAIPEGLPAVATAALSLGVLRMSRRRALVRRLASVETLGSTNVICTDKTGTLTVGQMTVRAMVVADRTYEVSGEGYSPEGDVRLSGAAVDPSRDSALRQMAQILVGCNNAQFERSKDNAWSVIGDPTEGALLSAGQKAGADRSALDRDDPRVHEIPFDSDRKLHSIVRRLPDGRLRVLTNGAPEMLSAKCSHIWREDGVHPLTDADREELARQNANLAGKALRVLGAAYRDFDGLSLDQLTPETVERDLVFVGLAGLYDPPRAEAKEAVAKCQAAGIRVVMITGDHPRTAIAIGRELGLAEEGQVATGVELDRLTDDALQQRVPRIAVYARVSAAHKLRIVRAWQANGAVVAMTGDGVNDAPAIKGADIGVAMGRIGTEVTKQASDMIVTDDNFATIVDAVEVGRGIYENIRKTLLYLLGCNASELLLITICIVSGLPTPLLPIHLLWINLVTDGPPALCLAADRVDPGLMSQRPRARGEQLADARFFWAMLLTGSLIAGVTFLAFLWGLQSGGLEVARTYAFCGMVFAQLLISLGARSQTTPIWRLDLMSNLNLLLVVSVSITIQMWTHISATLSRFLSTSQLPYQDGFVLLAAGAVPLLALEFVKLAPAAAKEERGAIPSTRWIGSITAVVIVATFAASWLYWPQPRETAAQFLTHAIERGDVIRAVTATGVVRPRLTTEVFAPLTGVVRFPDCEVGATVTKGQLCATIDQQHYRLLVERRRANLSAAQTQLDKDKKELARAKSTLERARASAKRSLIDKATSAHERALARTKRSENLTAQREAALRVAETAFRRTEVRAPMDGAVTFRRLETGQTVEAGRSMLFIITDHADAQIEVVAAPGEVGKVKIDDRASIKMDAAPGRALDGRATEIRKLQNVIVLSVPDAESVLESGMTATARIVIDERVNVLRAPNEALRYSRRRDAAQVPARGEKSDIMSIWVLRKEKPTPVPVRLGLDDGAYTEIVEGDFEPGDELIVGEKV
ncbi:HAD-IC family P-type ATPase [Methylocystis hirsuta]|uniref:Efflux RND transporter periplasmic adaptor subunit n=1 Tax=Methylocystis hirsuta TaxID=369798 RepID=A0A3M9XJW4_9HYPH|nr:HAD-IC family P-type ATPase [Methylocystis hirsuta]RNJ48181.1 efflux RND transporter periplasmic adaptor subunit [Methylocystis hirsuta]